MIPNRAILIPSHRTFYSPHLLLFVLLFQALFISCNSDSTVIGTSLQPPSEWMRAYYLDSIDIEAFTLSQDSIWSSSADTAFVGYLQDDYYFGTSTASFLSRVRLETAYFKPGPDAVADSIVLTLLPARVYGDLATKLNLKAYRLEEDILLDTVYYSNKIPVYDPATEHAKIINVTDTLIRFVLDTTFFIKETLADIDSIGSNEDLRNYFHGVYVVADNNLIGGEGAIMLLDLLSDDSKMTIYYHTATDTTEYDFLINITSARVNLFSHDHSRSMVHMDTTGTNEGRMIFVQGLAGTYARIDFPYLDDLSDLGDVAINKAEITFRIFHREDSALYPPPEELMLYIKDEEGEFKVLFDSQLGSDYFGGTLDEEAGEYSFTITNYVKDYLAGEVPYSSVYLFVRNQAISPERVILYNSSPPNNIRLRILYTVL